MNWRPWTWLKWSPSEWRYGWWSHVQCFFLGHRKSFHSAKHNGKRWCLRCLHYVDP